MNHVYESEKTGITLRILIFFQILLLGFAQAQNLYFPPLTGSEWETVSPAALGWDITKIDSLYSFLSSTNTKAFLVLKDGKIAIEKYFDSFTKDSMWYWASAGKSLTAVLVGIAEQEGKISLSDSTSKYLSPGWTSLSTSQEGKIKIIHQLTMTTGLDDGVSDPYCTLPTCLTFKSEPGTRWAYHNAPYTLLDNVIESATGLSMNLFFQQKLRPVTGMNGLYLRNGYNNVFYSSARSMARFGLLMLNKGTWNSSTIISDTSYFRKMVNTSQSYNLSYGYLWWLNGKESFMLPQSQFVFPGNFAPDAPQDMIAAIGKNGQIVNVVPRDKLVVIRMGEAPGSGVEVPTFYNNDIWKRLKLVVTPATGLKETSSSKSEEFGIYPVPADNKLFIRGLSGSTEPANVCIYSMNGEKVLQSFSTGSLDISALTNGIYFGVIVSGKVTTTFKFVKTSEQHIE
ncbi:hypothetical protein MASR1M107_14100 [Ignavibacteriales bacterium]